LAKAFGWDRPPPVGATDADARERVFARLSAEDWYDWLVGRADRKKGTTRRQAKVARLMLRRIRRPGLFRIDRAVLKSFLDEYKRHQQWLRDRIDPAWAATLERKIRRRELIANALLILFVGAILLNGAIAFAAVLIGEGRVGLLPLFIAFGAFITWILKTLAAEFLRIWRRR
jgi:hypothetical protein